MTIDSAIVQKNYQKPDIVRARPKRLVFLNAEGGIMVQEDVPPPPAPETEIQAEEKITDDQKFGGVLFTGGLLLAGYIVLNILTKK